QTDVADPHRAGPPRGHDAAAARASTTPAPDEDQAHSPAVQAPDRALAGRASRPARARPAIRVVSGTRSVFPRALDADVRVHVGLHFVRPGRAEPNLGPHLERHRREELLQLLLEGRLLEEIT